MAKKKDYSKEYRRARENFMRRRREWVKKFHWLVEAPAIPKNPTLKDIERLEKIKLKTTTERQAKKYEKAYDIAWDEGNTEVFKTPTNLFNYIPTEEEINIVREYEFETEPAESDEEIMADLESLISGLLETAFRLAATPQETERAERRAVVFRQVFWDAVAKVGNKLAYLKYLEDSSVHMQLTEIVTRGLLDSQEKTYNSCLDDFAKVLNIGRPITTEQSQDLTMYGRMGFDFSDTIYEG